VLTAFREDPGLRAFTKDVLRNPKISVIDYDGGSISPAYEPLRHHRPVAG
jgi:hypothetical protein